MTSPQMDAPAASEHAQRPRRRGRRVALAILAALVVIYAGYRLVLRQQVIAQHAAIRAAGYPATPGELDAWYPWPAGPNAADVYAQAFAALVDERPFESRLPVGHSLLTWPPAGAPLPDEMAEAAEEFLTANAAARALLREATAIAECRFPVDLTAGPEADFRHQRHLQRAATLAAVEARLAAHRGQGSAAAEAVLDMLAMARALDQEPMLFSRLVQISIRSVAAETFEAVLSLVDVPGEHLERLQAAFAGAVESRGDVRAMAGERAMGVGVFEGDLRDPVVDSLGSILKHTGLLDLDQLTFLRLSAAWVEAAADPAAALKLDVVADVKAQPRWRSLMTRIMSPAVSPFFRSSTVAQLRSSLAAAAAVAMRYRDEHGELPPHLDALTPAYIERVPVDPFDGQPLRLRHEADRAILYSVGLDGEDDQGAAAAWSGGRWEKGDLVFVLPR